jgi:hypothetical protein
VKRPAFWILLAVISAASAALAIRFFPKAFSIVALDIRMDRERALEEARRIAARDSLGPSGYLQAASFSLDSEAQTFIELEGGGKDAFTRMLREGLYSAYTWQVRQYREGEPNETTIRFTPEGRPYGFVEKLREDAPGAALDASAARQIAEAAARSRWEVDLSNFALVEQGQERRVGGRVDHTLTYERPSPTLNEGRYRLRLVVSGDRLSEITHFIQIPEAFSRRYAHMRSANDAIGTGSVVAMALLYIVGGIGVGLFFMLRKRWVIWPQAAVWGAVVGAMQALAMLNELPLLWMGYDTALPRTTFLAQQIALVLAVFFGFSAFLALSFMAAETLTRKAFGHHPQLWRAWSGRGSTGHWHGAPGASTAIAGRTVGGYLLVPVFLAYVVMFYYFAINTLGWWSPSEALLHPDVLATYVPWLSAIANSLQAGFWEESLFRAVPIAGAALIGDRLGQRRLFIVLAFIVQALVFGAGHAQYPGQPSYARVVELILPSIGFGLIYLFFGLLPAVVLHFAFDVVLFALPIFLASAPGIWFQKTMVVVMMLVPLWVVLWRRARGGSWTRLEPRDLNAAWTPPPAVHHVEVVEVRPRTDLSRGVRVGWLAAGAAGLIACGIIIARTEPAPLQVTRARAIDLGREAMLQRGARLNERWRVMAVPESGGAAPHEFVAMTAGEERRRALVGRYLPGPRWHVRAATFEGDVADRAEEWQAYVTPSGEVRNVTHTLPEGRAGASLDEEAARTIAFRALRERLALDAAGGQVKEVSARPAKLKARTDWTFTFVDTTVAPLPKGEPRIAVHLAGDEVSSTARFIYVPEEWERQQRAAETRNFIVRIVTTMVFAGLLVGAAVSGTIAWSRHRYTPWLFFAGAGLMLIISLGKSANSWPAVLATLSTAAPLQLQVLGVIAVGLVGLILSACLVGLALGALPHRLAHGGTLPDREALTLGVATGSFAAGTAAAAAWVRTPAWARAPNLEAAGTYLPVLQAAIDPLTRVLMITAVLLPALAIVDGLTSGWRQRRSLGAAILLTVGFAAGASPVGVGAAGWLLAGAITALALLVTHVTLLRYDLSMVPVAVGTMIAVAALAQGAQRTFAGALIGAIAAAALAGILGWWWFRALRRSRRHAAETAAGAPGEDVAVPAVHGPRIVDNPQP